jgi:hypothetical protein
MISLTPDEVESRFTHLGIPNRFSEVEKRQLATTAIVYEEPDLLAFPIPKLNSGLNILNLRRLLGTNPAKQPSFFDHPWYLEESFAAEDCAAGWHFIYTKVSPDSISKPVNYADSLKVRNLELPCAVEVALMVFLQYVGAGERLLNKKHTWCKDRASMDRWVTVGAFGRNGLFISGHPADFTSRGLGICPVRRSGGDGLYLQPGCG